ncbi:FdhF/YdeP family oxidoreductase [Pontibacter russatus]|uniref:FdhF/YdeP family oxidoreductase n=1 Tax=Pontibacter russatus TaxID=2694929 RepID=UPI00192A2244|nr:FdhF/YdeP family oxidoreductase [Pontibacter russatus]
MREQDSNNELTPEKFTGLRTGKLSKSAAGVPAVWSAMKQAYTYMAPSAAVKAALKLNQKDGFLCPGCAWPDPDDERSALGEYCENGLKAIAEEAQDKKIGADFFRRHSINEIGAWSDFEIGKKGRLTEPVLLKEGASHYEPVSWDEAFGILADELNALASPDEAVFYTSGRTSNEAAFLYQLFVRQFGTNNLPDCSNMCHESSGKALTDTLGIGKGSVTLEDFYQAEVVMILGQNPGTNHPRMLSALEKCKLNGGKIIAVNPIPEPGLLHFVNPQSPSKILSGGTPLADIFLQVRINGDVPLLKALMLVMLEAEKANPGSVFDHAFIGRQTQGYAQFIYELGQQDFDLCASQSGVEKELIREAARLLIEKKNIIVCWAMGLTQHENAVDNIKEVVNLLLLKGSIGKPGAGTCPVRGHSNVQGDRTMGIWEMPPPAFLDMLQAVYKFEPPRRKGFDVVNAIKAMNEGKARVFVAMGGNFLSATPDTAFTAAGLRQCNLTVHVSTKLNRSHVVPGRRALILPCLGRTDKDVQGGQEQFVSVENSMGVVQSSKGVLTPPSDRLLSEVAIVSRMAQATLGGRTKVDWAGLSQNYDLVRDEIEKVIPGFEDYNRRVRQPGGLYLPNCNRANKFNTAPGKALFSVLPLPKPKLEADEYLMMTIRSHDQFNTTIYGLDDRYRGIFQERRVVMMHRKDMESAGLQQGDVVDLQSHFQGQLRAAPRFLVVPMDISRGCVATYFPEANVLVPIGQVAAGSNTPASKSVAIKITKATSPDGRH